MGAITNNQGVRFASISKGKVVLSNGKGEQKTILDGWQGLVTDLKIEKDIYEGNEFDRLSLLLDDNKERIWLQMRLDSGYGRSVAFKLPNCNLKQQVGFQPTYNEETKASSVFVSQGGTNIKQKWSKDNPGELPPLVETTFKGKKVYDNTNQMEFIKDYLLNTIKPQLGNAVIDGPAHSFDNNEDDGSGLPF